MPYNVRIIGSPLDLGASRRGVDMGPSAIRIAGLTERLRALGHVVDDTRTIHAPPREQIAVNDEADGLRYLPAITAACADIARETAQTVRDGAFPIMLGGDHSLAAGSVAGVAQAYREKGKRIGLIWLDAHSDVHTPASTTSGNVHGMPVAHLLGHGDRALASLAGSTPAVSAENVVLVGLRDVDLPERDHIREWGIQAFTMSDIDERGIAEVMREALETATRDTEGVHVSLDMDFLDPIDAPGVGTPVRGGVTYREAHLAMELVCASKQLVGLDVVEVNPVLDRKNQTAELAVHLVSSALGLRIL